MQLSGCELSWYILPLFMFSCNIYFSARAINYLALSVQFSRSVMSDSLRPHRLQYARLPCRSTPGAHSNSCPLNRWCHLNISSSAVPFSSSLQSFPASGSFQMSQFFTSGGQNIEVSASASVLPVNIQDWFPLGWTLVSSISIIQGTSFSEISQLFSFERQKEAAFWEIIISGMIVKILLKQILKTFLLEKIHLFSWTETCITACLSFFLSSFLLPIYP